MPRARAKALDHVLIFGPPGLGKTTLAHILAEELGVALRQTSGPVLERAGDLAALLTNLQPRDVLGVAACADVPLGQRRRVGVAQRIVAAAREDGDHIGRAGTPAEAQTGSDRLRQRAKQQHRAGLGQAEDRRLLLALEAQIDVGVVLQNQQATLVGDLRQRVTALN